MMTRIFKIVQIFSALASTTKPTSLPYRMTASYTLFFNQSRPKSDIEKICDLLESIWGTIKTIEEIPLEVGHQNYVQTDLIESCLHKHTASGNLLSTFVKIRPKEFSDTFFQEAFTDKRLLTLVNSERFPVELKAQARKVIRDFSFYRDILIAVLNNGVQQENTPSLVDLIDKAISLNSAGDERNREAYSRIYYNLFNNTTKLLETARAAAFNIPLNTDVETTVIFKLDSLKKFDVLDFDFIANELQKMRFGVLSSLTRHDAESISLFRNGEMTLGIPDDTQADRMTKAIGLSYSYSDIIYSGVKTINSYVEVLLLVNSTSNYPNKHYSLDALERCLDSFKKMVSGTICLAAIRDGLNDKPVDQLLEGLEAVLKHLKHTKIEILNEQVLKDPKLLSEELVKLESIQEKLTSRLKTIDDLFEIRKQDDKRTIDMGLAITNTKLQDMKKILPKFESQNKLKREIEEIKIKIKEKHDLASELGRRRSEQNTKVITEQDQSALQLQKAEEKALEEEAELKNKLIFEKSILNANENKLIDEFGIQNKLELMKAQRDSPHKIDEEMYLRDNIEYLTQRVKDLETLRRMDYSTILNAEIAEVNQELQEINERLAYLKPKQQLTTG